MRRRGQHLEAVDLMMKTGALPGIPRTPHPVMALNE
jgi:hypothetical protein